MNFWLKRSLLWVMAAAFVTGCSNNDDVSSDSEQEGSAGSPPAAVQAAVPSDLKLVDGGSSRVFPLSALFTDADTALSDLQFSVDNPFPSVVSVIASNGTLTIQPLSASDQVVTVVVQARDDNGVASLVLQIEVLRPEDVPSNASLRRPLPDLVVAENATRRLDLVPFFSVDNDIEPTYTVERIAGTTARATISGRTLTVVAQTLGDTAFRVTATGSDGVAAADTLTATVSDQGAPPAILVQPDPIALERNDALAPIDLTALFLDDSDASELLTYDAQALAPELFNLRVESGLLVVESRNASGQTSIVITAVDTEGLQSAPLVVPAGVGTPPEGSIDDVTVPAQCPGRMDCPSFLLSLNDAFSDAENDDLSFRIADVSNPAVGTFNITSTGLLQINSGVVDTNSLVVVEAVDEIGLVGSAAFTVTVDNQTPAIADGGVPSQTLRSEGPDAVRTVDLNSFLQDLEDDSFTYTVLNVADDTIATVAATSTGVQITAQNIGSTSATIRATDQGGEFVQFALAITVNQLDNPPQVISGVDDIGLAPSTSRTVNLEEVFSDEDLTSLNFNISNTDEALVSVSEGANVLSLTAGSTVGQVVIALQAVDALGQVSETVRFAVTVSTPPVISQDSAIPDQVTANALQAKGGRLINLAAVFDDAEDGEPVRYEAQIADSQVATVQVVGNSLVLGGGLQDGRSIVTVTAFDSADLSVTDTFELEIVNNTPVAADPIATPPPPPEEEDDGFSFFDFFTAQQKTQLRTKATPVDVGGITGTVSGQLTVQMGTYIIDLEDDASELSFSVISNSRPQSVSFSQSGDTLSLTGQALTPDCDLESPNEVDCAALRFRAVDTGGEEADARLFVSIADSAPPQVLRGISDQALDITEGEQFEITLSEIFEDDLLAANELSYEVSVVYTSGGSGTFNQTPNSIDPGTTAPVCGLPDGAPGSSGILPTTATLVFTPTAGQSDTADAVVQLVARDGSTSANCSEVVSFRLRSLFGPDILTPYTQVTVRANRSQGSANFDFDRGFSISEVPVSCDINVPSNCDEDGEGIFAVDGAPSSITLVPASIIELVSGRLVFTTGPRDQTFEASVSIEDANGLEKKEEFVLTVDNRPASIGDCPGFFSQEGCIVELGVNSGGSDSTTDLDSFYVDFDGGGGGKPISYTTVRVPSSTQFGSASINGSIVTITLREGASGTADFVFASIDSGGERNEQFDNLILRVTATTP